MPKGPKGQKPPVVAPNNSLAKAIESWENEGGAPSMGDRSRKKGKDEKSFFGDFLEHRGQSAKCTSRMRRKKRPRDTP